MSEKKLTDEQIYAMFRQFGDLVDRLASVMEQTANNIDLVIRNLELLNELVAKEEEPGEPPHLRA